MWHKFVKVGDILICVDINTQQECKILFKNSQWSGGDIAGKL